MDTYLTILNPSQGTYSQLRSKFLAFAYPVKTEDEVKQHVVAIQKKYYDARHACYAYMLGADRQKFRANDNGEPSGTAGKPILGQINSNNLTDILIIVVRYFGGIKLGTSGLIQAYRAAAVEAIQAATIVEKTVDETIGITFPFPAMNAVMKVVKDIGPQIMDQGYADDKCTMKLTIRQGQMPVLKSRLEKIIELKIIENEQ